MSDYLMKKELSYFATYGTVILLKMALLSPVTGLTRVKRKAFANEEDMAVRKDYKEKKLTFNDPVIERMRRCHLNDLENIVPFFGLGLLYALFSGASISTLLWHYRIFTVSRLLHTIVYLYAIPQPSRALCFLAGFGVNVSMGVQLLMNNINL
ncbi:microsomal glutathione S-transferase 1-like [Diadema antillarum]|uniref:microsomal glutathione S-transferase 1-like n=1 Tax=Diadema antillarum TaxID=105358 RepID=UPI003A8C245D